MDVTSMKKLFLTNFPNTENSYTFLFINNSVATSYMHLPEFWICP